MSASAARIHSAAWRGAEPEVGLQWLQKPSQYWMADHANAFSEAGHEVQIFLLGEAVNLMKNETMNSVTPVGWPPLSKIMQKTIKHKIPLNI